MGGEQKRKLLKECYIFALPTRYPNEGQPISILEAMGNGMFIITTNHAGIPDIVEDGVNGIVMNNEFFDTKIIYCILKTKTFIDICKVNRKKTLEKYCETQYINGVLRIFKKF